MLTYMCVSVHVYVCVNVCACMYLYAPMCVLACASVHTGLRACMCARAGVLHAHVRACGGGCMHIREREECAYAVSVPASSPPWKPSVGLACMPCSYSNSGAPGAAASEPLAV
jgi:hypothetical protein